MRRGEERKRWNCCTRAAPPPDRILHYDPRSLHRTETPVVPMAVFCARCFRALPPDEAERGNTGELVCQDKEECAVQQDRNEHGGW